MCPFLGDSFGAETKILPDSFVFAVLLTLVTKLPAQDVAGAGKKQNTDFV